MERNNWQILILVLFSIGFLAGLIGLFLKPENASAFVTISIAMAGVLILSSVLPQLSEFTIGPKGVGGKLSKLEERQDNVESRLNAIQIALEGIVTKFEYPKLLALSQASPFEVYYRPELYLELQRLDSMGFIRPCRTHGLIDIQDEYNHRREEVFNLKDYVEITKLGRKYLEIRGEITPSEEREDE